MEAVLTGDLIDSRSYSTSLLDSVLDGLKAEFAYLTERSAHSIDFELYRGDSFQGMTDLSTALEDALILYAAVRRVVVGRVSPSSKPAADLRISLGIGDVQSLRLVAAESSGAAFYYSGGNLDVIKRSGLRFGIKCSDAFINGEFAVQARMLDHILSRWSVASAEVVYLLLRGYKEQEIAYQLEISQPAVNLRKQAAGWDVISAIIDRYKRIIHYLSTHSVDHGYII